MGELVNSSGRGIALWDLVRPVLATFSSQRRGELWLHEADALVDAQLVAVHLLVDLEELELFLVAALVCSHRDYFLAREGELLFDVAVLNIAAPCLDWSPVQEKLTAVPPSIPLRRRKEAFRGGKVPAR